MKIRLTLLLLILLALPACAARQAGAATTAASSVPTAAETAAVKQTVKAAVTPTTAVLVPTITTTAVPSPTPTEISPLVLTLVASTGTPGAASTSAAANPSGAASPSGADSPAPEVPLTYQSVFRDTLDDNAKGWVLSEGMEISQGVLRMWTASRDINAVVAPLAEHTQADVSIRANVQVVQWDGASSLMFGAGCRMNESTYDQYMMFIGPLGKEKAMLQMAKFKSGRLVQMTDLPHIFKLPQDITQNPVPFEFICSGQNLTFKVGAETIASLTDGEYTSGSIDLFVMGADKKAAVAFDQVEVSQVKVKK